MGIRNLLCRICSDAATGRSSGDTLSNKSTYDSTEGSNVRLSFAADPAPSLEGGVRYRSRSDSATETSGISSGKVRHDLMNGYLGSAECYPDYLRSLYLGQLLKILERIVIAVLIALLLSKGDEIGIATSSLLKLLLSMSQGG